MNAGKILEGSLDPASKNKSSKREKAAKYVQSPANLKWNYERQEQTKTRDERREREKRQGHMTCTCTPPFKKAILRI